uniref:Homing endonuclease LAGLIDADG domain-containing protein n=1 Tax=Borodinellopsis insignis TaxID=3229915 RepID=A0AB39A6B2_9CHLO
MMYGYLASDGYVNKYGNIAIQQSVEKLKFVEWMHAKFKDYRTETTDQSISVAKETYSEKTFAKRFFTRCFFKGFRKTWYQPTGESDEKGDPILKKRLPKNLAGVFSPYFIAMWFAGDGLKPLDHRGARFEVTDKTPAERIILKNLFKRIHNLDVKIVKNGTARNGTAMWALAVGSAEYSKFRKIVTCIDVVETCFPYKLHPNAPAPLNKNRRPKSMAI